MADSCVGADEQSLSFIAGDARTQLGKRDEMAPGNIHTTTQCPASQTRTSIPGTLSSRAGGGGIGAVFSNGEHLHSSQSCPGQIDPDWRRKALEISMEQLSQLRAESVAGVVGDGARAGQCWVGAGRAQ